MNPFITEIFTRLRDENPKPVSELKYNSNFELLVAVILSAQATDIGVNKATAGLFKVANTPAKMVALGVVGLKKYIKTIGLYNAKARNIIATSRILLDDFGGAVPRRFSDLIALPGVGRKTANVILNTAFGQPTIAVDTHVFRVSNRLGIADGCDVAAVEAALLKNVPEEFKTNAHHWLILLGRYICIARKPKCSECVLGDLCPSAQI